jgi:hypothetical protein
MLPPLLDNSQPSPADKWLWALLGALVVGQIVALWLLCSQQVEKAQVRDAVLHAQRTAMIDACAPKNGRATCLPANTRRPPAADVNAVMDAMR